MHLRRMAYCNRSFAFGLFGGLAILFVFVRPQPILIYNPSPSAPVGFYVRTHDRPNPGAFVTVRAAAVAPAYAAARGFADDTDRFVKRVAAAGGARVCAEGAAITIDGRFAALRRAQDAAGRELPSWSGCRTLPKDSVFLLGNGEDSFDGRYWGPTPIATIDAVWRPLHFCS